MEFKGTKGKWTARFLKYGNFPKGEWSIKSDDDCETPIGLLPEPLGGVKDNSGVSPIQKANAKLIAAAPEMLKALQSLVQDFEGDYVMDDGEIVDNPPETMIYNYHEAKKAIEKALK